ncbi:MAG: hypothetical protein NZ583_05610 [Desulfobacterota bacterium]|nr:hypothetical protein [Thermodesulfobacteriota bacterium]MDW8002674.1 hypothetical protein [Deltaproteobacteria bacterium]
MVPYGKQGKEVFGISESVASFYRKARRLALFTIFYNILEGIVSVYFGVEDETIALFGFGLDSFVEVMSGLGIYLGIRRMEGEEFKGTYRFEKLALRITGSAFYILSAGLFATAFLNAYFGRKPETTIIGIVISIVSILTMALLMKAKLSVGNILGSEAIVEDAHCTRACMYLSFILLLSSLGYEIFGLGLIDSLGAAGIAYHALKEGKEAFEKAKKVEDSPS